MNILGWMVFGFVVALVSRAAVPGRGSAGLMSSIILGMAGALFGGWLGQALDLYESTDGGGFVAATIGAIVVLLGYKWIKRSKSRQIEAEFKSTREEPPSSENKAA